MDMTNQAIAAFMGAFFAFLFVRIGEMLTKIYARQVKNYNALVKIEYFCIEKVDTIANNIKIIDDFQSILGEALVKNLPVVYANRLNLLKFDENILLDLSSIDFINEVLSFKVSIGRFNNDMEMLNSMCDNFQNGLMQGHINYQTYKVNMECLLTKMDELKKHLMAMEKKTVEIAACAKVLTVKQKPLFTRFLHLIYCKKAFSEKFHKKVKQEIQQIEKDRQEVAEKSRKEIEDIRKA